MIFPDRKVPTFGGLSCLEIQEQYLSGIAVNHCDQHRKMLADKSLVDIFAFCGCNVTATSPACTICDASAAVSIRDRSVKNPLCNDMTGAARYIVNQDLCQKIQTFTGDCCDLEDQVALPPCSLCGTDDVSNIAMDQLIPGTPFACADARDFVSFFLADSDICKTEFAPWAQVCCRPTDRCSLCSDPSSAILHPEHEVPFSRDVVTCAEVEFGLGTLQSDKCDSFHNVTASVDLAAWCGCEDAEEITPTCSLCGNSDVIKDFKILGAPSGVTCQSLSDWAPYVRDNAFCETRILPHRLDCCDAPHHDNLEGASPTSSPSSKMNNKSSAGIPCYSTWLVCSTIISMLVLRTW